MSFREPRNSTQAATHRPKRKRIGLAISAIAISGALALTGCAGSTSAANTSGEAGQVLRFAISNEPTKLTTGMNEGTVANTMLTLIHRGLMTYDSNGELTEGLADKVDQTDPLTYEVILRENLTFHDGTALTAKNVKNSLDYYADKAVGSSLLTGLDDIASIDVVDDTHLVIQLSAPSSAFLSYLATPAAAIVPDSSLNPEGNNWVGAGPFSLTNHDKGIGLVLEKFDDYHAADEVSLTEIDMSFYADGEARTNALISGDVDFIDYVPWENFDRVSNTAGLALDAQAGPFQYVNFNVAEGPFANPKVREAVAYALNRENSVLAPFLGHGQALFGPPISETDPAFDPSMKNLWSYDPTKAKSLLAEAGYPDGFEATLLTTSQYKFLQDTALSVQADLEAIGIKVKLDAPDWPGRIAKGNAGDYDIAVSGSAGMIADPTYINGYVTGPNDYSRSVGYDNAELNSVLEDGLRASNDADKKKAYKKAFEIIKTDVPFATLSTRDQAYAFNSRVTGFKNLPGFLSFYSGYSLANVSLTNGE
ncbi:ABC transporter substrate-binding protein [Paeniglutamicibacter sp. MACA_103]|uniref:ABC transporter substrate-binding protein n=1 Tax=Paeniglutamicibacter sp. MACA_103 TaxID=3377337 RepID=UPI003893841D